MDFYAIGTKKHFVGKSVLTLNVMVPNKYVSEPSYDLKFSLYANLTYQIRSVTQSCPTLCDPIDGSPPGFPVPGILQAGTWEWVTISFSNA